MTEGWRWPAYLSRRLHWKPSIFWHRGLWDGFCLPSEELSSLKQVSAEGWVECKL